jgi:hypothetical protein
MYATPAPKRSTAAVIGIATLCVLAIASTATALVLALTSHSSTAHAAPTPKTPSHSHTVSPAHPVNPNIPNTPVQPQWSNAVASVQRELGSLNYYEGPITGVMNQQTHAAISYLQRDPHQADRQAQRPHPGSPAEVPGSPAPTTWRAEPRPLPHTTGGPRAA